MTADDETVKQVDSDPEGVYLHGDKDPQGGPGGGQEGRPRMRLEYIVKVLEPGAGPGKQRRFREKNAKRAERIRDNALKHGFEAELVKVPAR